ncbi:ImmA/IrrE family metallo-endopeptidase [Variovorax sp. RB2P76]|uniref:ImmA/IrrE family metallo-endopeptidase n=1 Tax=Variovorax sp. RB2P76 TaxID=3443736 RepID=UPI003F473BCE
MASLSRHLASRNLSWEVAAKRSGLSAERLRDVAAGASASLSEIRKIANVLRVPVSSLLIEPEQADEEIRLLFRRELKAEDPNSDTNIDIASTQIRDVLALAEGMATNTWWLSAFDGDRIDLTSAEALAEKFRTKVAGLDDLNPFDRLAEFVTDKLGIFLLYCRDPLIDGVSAIVKEYAFILLGPRSFMPRVLFTLAHELGHIVAHHDSRSTGYAFFDREGQADGTREPSRDEERFADYFASCLLLPKHGVLRALKAIRQQVMATGPLGDYEINALARLYGVSFEVAGRRCEQLGLLGRHEARALYQKLVHDHVNPERRADEMGLPPRPTLNIRPNRILLRHAANEVRSGKISIGRASEILNVSIESLYQANSEISV